MDYSLPVSSVHGDSASKNTGVGCHALLQEIFPTHGSNPGLPRYRQILYQLSYQGSYQGHILICTVQNCIKYNLSPTFDMQLNNVLFYEVVLSLFMLCFCLLVHLICPTQKADMTRLCLWERGKGVKESSWDVGWLKNHSGESGCPNIFLSCLLRDVQGEPLLYLYCCEFQ